MDSASRCDADIIKYTIIGHVKAALSCIVRLNLDEIYCVFISMLTRTVRTYKVPKVWSLKLCQDLCLCGF